MQNKVMEKQIKDLIKRHWEYIKDKENKFGIYSDVYPKKIHNEYVRGCIEETGFESTKLRLECVIEHGIDLEQLHKKKTEKPKRKYKKKSKLTGK